MRIRTIKPEFWQHEIMAGLSEFARLLAIALLNYADDEGYFLASPHSIRGAVFPFMEDSSKITGALSELYGIGYIKMGKLNDGRAIGHVVKFNEHQVISHSKPSKFKGSSIFHEDSSKITGALSEDSSNVPVTFQSGIELNRSELNLLPPSQAQSGELFGDIEQQPKVKQEKPDDSDFHIFWSEYPNKKAKAEAQKSWNKLKPDITTVLKALLWQKKSPQWIEKDGQYIPMPSTYLNQKRWEDEQVISKPKTATVWKGPSCL